MKFKGAIFDMDGTLLDSMYRWRNLGSYFLRKKGFNPPADFETKFRAAGGFYQGIHMMREQYNLPGTDEDVTRQMFLAMEEYYQTEVELKPGVLDLLQGLQEKGIKMAVATATPSKAARMGLERTGILKYFDALYSCHDMDAGKEEPTIYLVTMEDIGTKVEDTIVFEDALYAARTAKNAGFALAAIQDGTEPEQEALKSIADWYLPTPGHWREIMQGI